MACDAWSEGTVPGSQVRSRCPLTRVPHNAGGLPEGESNSRMYPPKQMCS
jgi:hypothetical protein